MTLSQTIVGAHSSIYIRRPEADRTVLREILGLSHVDAGEDCLIFGLPPAELAIHPSLKNDIHEFYFMSADIGAFMAAARDKGVSCGPVQSPSWGNLAGLGCLQAENWASANRVTRGPDRRGGAPAKPRSRKIRKAA